MAAVQAQCMNAAARTSKHVTFAPSQMRGNILRAVPISATRKQINTVCKAIVSLFVLYSPSGISSYRIDEDRSPSECNVLYFYRLLLLVVLHLNSVQLLSPIRNLLTSS